MIEYQKNNEEEVNTKKCRGGRKIWGLLTY